MKFEVKISTLFWWFVWPICPLLGLLVAVAWGKEWSDVKYYVTAHSSLFLTAAYAVILVLSLMHWSVDVTHFEEARATVPYAAESEVAAPAFDPPINVTIQYRPMIEFLPWSLPREERVIVRCKCRGETWWIDAVAQKRLHGDMEAWAERAYRTYCGNRDQEKREREEAETIQKILKYSSESPTGE